MTLPHDDLAVTAKASVVQSSSTCATSLPGYALLPVAGLLDLGIVGPLVAHSSAWCPTKASALASGRQGPHAADSSSEAPHVGALPLDSPAAPPSALLPAATSVAASEVEVRVFCQPRVAEVTAPVSDVQSRHPLRHQPPRVSSPDPQGDTIRQAPPRQHQSTIL